MTEWDEYDVDSYRAMEVSGWKRFAIGALDVIVFAPLVWLLSRGMH